ncbi:MAG: tRNA (adenosine(37)-N6)-threonylcarbamoyltransferase complex transferase subunit TsaD [bacterium]
MNILAIETSCDETAMCYIEAIPTELGTDFIVHKNITHTQLEHKEYGGVFPAIAKREHQINLPIILEQVMAGHDIPDYICVTNGPGLEPALWCGIVFAKELGQKWNIPVVPVNHMEGHILSVLVPPLLSGEGLGVKFAFNNTIIFPALALLISGGHTELVLVKEIGDYKIVGKTRDDAVGEAFDKAARLMGLDYPGGPEIAQRAEQYSDQEKPVFPRPMLHTKDFDFSFSGLKTAVLYYIQSLGSTTTEEQRIAIAYEFQEAATEVLVTKTRKAMDYFGAQSLIVAGGVSANKRIINGLQTMTTQEFPGTSFLAPVRELTGDNSLMIALAGYFKIQKSPDTVYTDIKAQGNLQL